MLRKPKKRSGNSDSQQQQQPESAQNEFEAPAYEQHEVNKQFQQRESFKKQTSPMNQSN